ncbi:MAG: phosphoribosylaminoimidazolesuccinocarboxamide synthase, partial [Armatimonadota bacterium]
MIVTSTDIKGLRKHVTGKVRDVYDLGTELLIVATDRISAFDVVLPTPIPDKGKVLTQMSLFWFDFTKDIIDNHLITADIDEVIERIANAGAEDAEQYKELLRDRSMIAIKAKPIPIECIVRGYLAGSAWKEYSALRAAASGGGSVLLHGIELPVDMIECQKLPRPVFTPATKETAGHDVNI